MQATVHGTKQNTQKKQASESATLKAMEKAFRSGDIVYYHELIK